MLDDIMETTIGCRVSIFTIRLRVGRWQVSPRPDPVARYQTAAWLFAMPDSSSRASAEDFPMIQASFLVYNAQLATAGGGCPQ